MAGEQQQQEAVSDAEARVLHHPGMINPLGDPQEADSEAEPSIEMVESEEQATVEESEAVADEMDDETQPAEDVVVEGIQTTDEEPVTFTKAEVDLIERAARAEEGRRAATEHAAQLQEQLRTQAAEPEPPHPLVEALEQAGVDPALLDDYLDRKQEAFLHGLGNQVEQQNQMVTAAHEAVAEVFPGFNAAKLEAWMTEHPDEARVIEQAKGRDLQAGLLSGWAMMEATAPRETTTVETPAAAPKPRVGVRGAGVKSDGQKIAPKNPATTWAEMSAAERQKFMKQLDEAPDGSALQKKLLRIRMPSTDARVQAQSGRYAWKREDY